MTKENCQGPFAGWVEDYDDGSVVLEVVHGSDDVRREKIPVSECGRLMIGQSVDVDEALGDDGIVHAHIHQQE